jgi:hypothetical protein
MPTAVSQRARIADALCKRKAAMAVSTAVIASADCSRRRAAVTLPRCRVRTLIVRQIASFNQKEHETCLLVVVARNNSTVLQYLAVCQCTHTTGAQGVLTKQQLAGSAELIPGYQATP